MSQCDDRFNFRDTSHDEFDMHAVGPRGPAGVTFTPHVSSSGILSWTNDGGLPNPEPVSILGPEGPQGEPGNYTKPSSGIPKSDLASSVQGSLDKADAAAPADLGITGASVGDLVRISAVDANNKPTEFTKVPLNEIKCNRNLLDNWYFVGGGSQLGYGTFPINQRGQTTYSGTGYGIDRWKNIGDSTFLSINNDCVTLAASTTNAYSQQFFGIPNNGLGGKSVTFSVITKENGAYKLYSQTGTVPTTIAGQNQPVALLSDAIPYAAGFGVYLRNANDGKRSGLLYVQLGISSGHGISLVAVKVELGDTQTLAHQENGVWVLNEIPNYETELLECKTSTGDPSDTYANGSVEFGSNVGIVQNTDTATQNITEGQYVIWKGTLYKASSAIASGATLSGSNLTAVLDGGLNDLAYFTPGQRYTVGFFGCAFVTDGGKSISISITSGRRLLRNPTVESLKLTVRGVSGYVDIFNYTQVEAVGNTNFTITSTPGINFLEVILLKDSALTNATNNTPATANGTITFLA